MSYNESSKSHQPNLMIPCPSDDEKYSIPGIFKNVIIFTLSFPLRNKKLAVLDLVSQVRDAILMNVYLEERNPGGSGFWSRGYMSKGREMGRSVSNQPETKVDGSCHS
jgi:hypothetical protein